MSLAIAIFASGGGTNLQALLDYFGGGAGVRSGGLGEGSADRGRAGAPGGPGESGESGKSGESGESGESGKQGARVARIVLVVSDREGAGALERARRAGVEARVIPVRGREPDEVGEEMLGALREAGADLVVLAGYLRLMPVEVVRAYRGRMLNIHPALLPAFGGRGMYGLNIHRAVLEAGCRVSGVTVHFVDERYDTGPILVQWPVPVLAGDTPESLAARVLGVEHRILPLAVEFLARRVLVGEMVGGEEAGDAGEIGAAGEVSGIGVADGVGGGGVLGRGGAVGGAGEGGGAGGVVEVAEEGGNGRGTADGDLEENGQVLAAPVVFGLRDGVAPSEEEVRRLLGFG